jgi:hypothetical protein
VFCKLWHHCRCLRGPKRGPLSDEVVLHVDDDHRSLAWINLVDSIRHLYLQSEEENFNVLQLAAPTARLAFAKCTMLLRVVNTKLLSYLVLGNALRLMPDNYEL